MSNGHQLLLSFDDVTVDCENFRVTKGEENRPLTPRAFDVLVFLMKQKGRVVEKAELFEAVWRENFVSDNALTKVIKEIRQALSDDANAPRYIETVPKRGYRFIAEIADTPTHPVPSIPAAGNFERRRLMVLILVGLVALSLLAGWLLVRKKRAEAANAAVRTIAVLPFKRLSADSSDPSLEMGMAETLITRLSSLRQLVVRPITSVRKYSSLEQDPVKAGQEIQAQAVLDGNIQKAGDRVRVTVRLIDVRNGQTIWSQRFDEPFNDIFKVQDSIAEQITKALALELSLPEKQQLAKHATENPEAYQLYLQGQLLWHGRRQNWIQESLNRYEQSLVKDPNFALAQIGMADGYIMLSGHRRISMTDAETKARPHIMRALEIDPDLAQAHNAFAELKYQYEYDWTGAEKEFKTAIELNPNIAWIRQAYGWFLMSMGRFDEAATEMDLAHELDPSSLTINIGRARLYYFSRQYDLAVQQFKNIIAVEPSDYSAYLALFNCYERQKMYPEAVDTLTKFQLQTGGDPRPSERWRQTFKEAGWDGLVREQLADLEHEPQSQVNASNFVNTYLRAGRNDKAMEWLEKSFEMHDPVVLQLKVEPAYDPLRGDPRFVRLLHKIGLQ
jgi:TolB-like protein/DNA-binding winged helix-turn-helix (wHTH) protein